MILDIILAIAGLLVICLIWVAIFDTNRFKISNYKFKDKKIKKDFKAILVSDLHNKCYGQNNKLLVEAISIQKPDMIFIAGDILNGNPREKLDVAINFLEQIAEICPIYYADGNHETRMKLYREDYGDRYDVYCDKLKELGIVHLVNEKIVLEDYGIEILGSDIAKEHYKRFTPVPLKKEELEADLGVVSKKHYDILIAHNPYFFDAYAEYGPDLVLSGHVHGGIVRIPLVNKGVLSPNIAFFPKYDAGVYTKDDTAMLVSRGLGIHTIPFRLFNPGDLIVMDFSNK